MTLPNEPQIIRFIAWWKGGLLLLLGVVLAVFSLAPVAWAGMGDAVSFGRWRDDDHARWGRIAEPRSLERQDHELRLVDGALKERPWGRLPEENRDGGREWIDHERDSYQDYLMRKQGYAPPPPSRYRSPETPVGEASPGRGGRYVERPSFPSPPQGDGRNAYGGGSYPPSWGGDVSWERDGPNGRPPPPDAQKRGGRWVWQPAER